MFYDLIKEVTESSVRENVWIDITAMSVLCEKFTLIIGEWQENKIGVRLFDEMESQIKEEYNKLYDSIRSQISGYMCGIDLVDFMASLPKMHESWEIMVNKIF